MVFTACGLVTALVPATPLSAQTAAGAAPVQLAQATPPSTNTTTTKTHSTDITVRAAKRLLKEKDSPSAVTELGASAIAQASIAGSPGTLLRQAPSVYVYQQGLGDNAPELTIRGVRGLEIASTLDGVPTQDLEAPGSFYLANNIGGVFTLGQISGVSIYPGVAYPDQNTFGTIGGTVAYQSKRPTNDYYLDVVGSIGSFGTYKEGFELNSGAIDSPLGTGDNAAKVLLNYYNFQTQGFIDNTPNRENEMEFAFDKPYNDGLSAFQSTVIYNTANGLIENEPVPVPYLQQNGEFSNYPTSQDSATEKNDYLLVIMKDNTYVNDYINVGLTAFYLHNDNYLNDYGNIGLDLPGGEAGPATVNGSSPFINNPAGFGEGGLYGPPVGGGGLGIFGGGTGGYFYGGGNHYNPAIYYNNPKACPANVIAAYGSAAASPCGLSDEISGGHSDTYGIQPRFDVIPPEIFGINNIIKFGGMLAKETSPSGYEYLGAFANTPEDAQNAAYVPNSGGTQRTIYQAFVQDKIDALGDTLHITPGITLEGTNSSFVNKYTFGSLAAPAYGPNGLFSVGGTNIDQYGYYKSTRWDRDPLPFFNITYDLDKVLPALTGLSVYGSTGNSALFAPVTDFGPNTAGPPPAASIVHMYEGGVKYNTATLLVTADYFYQKVDRDFGFFEFQSGPQNGLEEYSNNGQREFKGFEASVAWKVTPDITLKGNASHLSAHYLVSGFAFDTVAEDQYGIELKGDPVSGVPDWIGNFGAEWDHKSLLRDGDSTAITFSGTYTGHQYTTTDYSGSDYLNPAINFPGLLPLNYTGCVPGPNNPGCAAYTRYNQITGATVTDTSGGGINPFVVFNLDAQYTLPTPTLPVLKSLKFDLNVQNLFNQFYYQYFYKQVSPASCGTFTSGPFTGLAKNNYSCTPEFADGIPGQPFSVFFTVTARF
jgi:iron complex outermembrane receptor protein